MRRLITQDLYLGAYIMSKGGVLEDVQLTGGRGNRPSVAFVFAGEDVDALSREFQSGQANTNVASFKGALTHLKDVMFNALRQTGTR